MALYRSVELKTNTVHPFCKAGGNSLSNSGRESLVQASSVFKEEISFQDFLILFLALVAILCNAA